MVIKVINANELLKFRIKHETIFNIKKTVLYYNIYVTTLFTKLLLSDISKLYVIWSFSTRANVCLTDCLRIANKMIEKKIGVYNLAKTDDSKFQDKILFS